MPPPLVTVYIPTHKRPKLLLRAVTSVLRQSYQELEIRVVLDGPDQATSEALGPLSADRRLIVTTNPTRSGACVARNLAISQARGEFITGLDDDDEFEADHVQRLYETLATHGGSFACTTSRLRRHAGDQVRHVLEGPISLKMLCRKNVIGNQVFTKTASLQSLGGFDPKMPAWQDYELWFRLCKRDGPGFKADHRSYIQHLDHEADRITNPERIRQAQRLFVEKHCDLLSYQDRVSLELLALATSHEVFGPRQALRFIRAGHGVRTFQAIISDRLPFLRPLARRLLSR